MRDWQKVLISCVCAAVFAVAGAAQVRPDAGPSVISVSTSASRSADAAMPGARAPKRAPLQDAVSASSAAVASNPAAMQPAGGSFPITISTALPSNINAKYPGTTANPSLNGTPTQNPTPATSSPVALPEAAAGAGEPLADRLLSRRVREALLRAIPPTPGVGGEAPTGGLSDLTVTAANGKVTLHGTVDSQNQKDAAAAQAAGIVGGEQNVENQIEVR
ncbi:MAG: BON domain-containing protein [Elusimicrobia bacterium]|nr:BON domain-containing protein [Elusimicrobiota bacterium]